MSPVAVLLHSPQRRDNLCRQRQVPTLAPIPSLLVWTLFDPSPLHQLLTERPSCYQTHSPLIQMTPPLPLQQKHNHRQSPDLLGCWGKHHLLWVLPMPDQGRWLQGLWTPVRQSLNYMTTLPRHSALYTTPNTLDPDHIMQACVSHNRGFHDVCIVTSTLFISLSAFFDLLFFSWSVIIVLCAAEVYMCT